MILGITGGMGCGKSAAVRCFEERGFRCLDSDEIVRNRLLPDAAVRSHVVDRYGASALDSEGELNRRWLAGRVFSDDVERAWLEGILHPRLFAIWRAELAAAPQARWVFEVPLLHEKGLENWFDFTICVSSTPDVQFARLEQRGITRAQAELRILKQLPLARKIELSDFVVGNDGTLEFLRRQVTCLVRRLVARL